MKKMIALSAAGLIALGLTAPAQAQSAGHILRGAGIGAAGGAVVGAIVPGMSVGKGALIGGAGGAIYNTIDKGNHQKKRKYRRHYRR